MTFIENKCACAAMLESNDIVHLASSALSGHSSVDFCTVSVWEADFVHEKVFLLLISCKDYEIPVT